MLRHAQTTCRYSDKAPARACASGDPRHEIDGRAKVGSPDPRRGKAVDNGGLRYGAMESALRPPLPTATRAAPHKPSLPIMLWRPHPKPCLTNPGKRNIIPSIRGSRRPVADIKSEPRPASNRNRWPASYWNARPASSESASEDGVPIGTDRDPTNKASLCAIPMDCAPFEEGSGLGAETHPEISNIFG